MINRKNYARFPPIILTKKKKKIVRESPRRLLRAKNQPKRDIYIKKSQTETSIKKSVSHRPIQPQNENTSERIPDAFVEHNKNNIN